MKKIWIPWWEWECHKAGLYESRPPGGKSADDCREAYRAFLSDIERFEKAMIRVGNEWPNSCLHFLTNQAINRVAWLGWSAMCIETKVSSVFCGGYALLTLQQKRAANKAAERFLQRWIYEHERKNQSLRGAMEEKRIHGGYPGRSPGLLAGQRACSFIQGDLFCDIA